VDRLGPRLVNDIPQARLTGINGLVSLSETQSCWQLISNRAMLPPYARGL
jgi:hypothetical protein